ncbi:MAG: hypothetical protein HZA51_13900 [Planctomycetes bacterium]|nr:hypothetical protein [Planctomycetota bacterium]
MANAIRRRPSLAVFLGCLLAYHLNFRVLVEVDCLPAPYTAWQLVKHGTFDLTSYPEADGHINSLAMLTSDGQLLSRYPPGCSLACLPTILPVALVMSDTPPKRVMMHLGKLAAAIWVSGAVMLFYQVVRAHWPQATTSATVLFAFGTNLASVASQGAWGHGPAVFFVMLASWFWLNRDGAEMAAWRAFAIGFSLGAAISCRYGIAIQGAFAALAFIWLRWWRQLIPLALGASLPIVALMLFNSYYFNAPLSGGYRAESSFGWNGLSPIVALLVSPSRGLLVFTPALLVPFIGVQWIGKEVRTNRERAVFLFTTVAAAIGTTIFYGCWWCWWNGWSYGPRFLIECLPAWVMLYAAARQWGQHAGRRAIIRSLVGLSVAIHVGGMINRTGYKSWHKAFDAGRVSVWNLRESLIIYQFRGIFRSM